MITRNRYNLQGDTCYQGLSTDTKPTDDVPLNALFLELDTGKFYYYDGSTWAEVGGGVPSQVLWEGTINASSPDQGGGGGYWSTDIEYMVLPENIVVEYDGTEYECSAYTQQSLDGNIYGAPWDDDLEGYNFNDYPFRINNVTGLEIVPLLASTEGEHTVKISG